MAGVAQQPFCSQSSQQSTPQVGFWGVLIPLSKPNKFRLVGSHPHLIFPNLCLSILDGKMLVSIADFCSSLKSTIQVSKFGVFHTVGEFFPDVYLELQAIVWRLFYMTKRQFCNTHRLVTFTSQDFLR